MTTSIMALIFQFLLHLVKRLMASFQLPPSVTVEIYRGTPITVLRLRLQPLEAMLMEALWEKLLVQFHIQITTV